MTVAQLHKDSDIAVMAVPSAMIDELWPSVEHFVQMAVDESQGELALDPIHEGLKDGAYLMILVVLNGRLTAALVLDQIIHISGMKTLLVMTAGGDRLLEWLGVVYDTIVDIAKDFNCDRIQVTGRKGWIKRLGNMGLDYSHAVMTLNIRG